MKLIEKKRQTRCLKVENKNQKMREDMVTKTQHLQAASIFFDCLQIGLNSSNELLIFGWIYF